MRRHSGRPCLVSTSSCSVDVSWGRQELVEALVCFLTLHQWGLKQLWGFRSMQEIVEGSLLNAKLAPYEVSILIAIVYIAFHFFHIHSVKLITHDATKIQISWLALILPLVVRWRRISHKTNLSSLGITATTVYLHLHFLYSPESCCLCGMLKGLKELITDDVSHLQPINSCCSFLIAATRNYCFFFAWLFVWSALVSCIFSHFTWTAGWSLSSPSKQSAFSCCNYQLSVSLCCPYLQVSVYNHTTDICFSEPIVLPSLAAQSSPTCRKGCVSVCVCERYREFVWFF